MKNITLEHKLLLTAITIGVTLVIFLGFVNGNFEKTSFGDFRKDAEIYNQTAFFLLDSKSFHGPDSLIVGGFRRAPGYPIFLAGVYSIFGRYPASVWFFQTVLFVISIILMWQIGRRFLPDKFASIPALLFSLSWFIAYSVTAIKTEILSVILFCSFSIFCWFILRRGKDGRDLFFFWQAGQLCLFLL